ncbi:phosphopantetheine-binding protein [Saccharothrix xinjiangensis]|uniref:Phosphopantetheine-binding protein n=1 Tax=Saccharothrix xinjiangensis TaxID=204798 RepID=A0ABV9YDZ0_9PSEU
MRTIEEYEKALVGFIGAEFLPAAERAQLTPTTPLMESGILDSLRVAVLLTHIRDDLGVHVPFERMDARGFADIATISRMLVDAVPVAGERA